MIDQDNMSALSRQLRDTVRFARSFNAQASSFAQWQSTTRAFVVEALGVGNARAAQSRTLEQQDHKTHHTRLVELTFSSGEKTEAFLLLPFTKNKSPAVLLLHDHGSRFDIGKEKLIQTSDPDKARSSEEWIKRCYGERYLGDILVKRGYVVLCADALGWSSREGNGYDAQQALAANLMQFGTSLAAIVASEDLQAALYLSALPEVDERFVASMGFSFGGFRAWQVAALTPAISASVAINWMGQLAGLMQPGANLLRGQSAYYMLHPQLAGKLDYPDIAALVAPRHALFYAGDQDPHFPGETVEAAFAALASVWTAASAAAHLETRIWPAGHVFGPTQQDAAIQWMDSVFGR
ncbi:dienelactone hydrolase family protein (plasmid) [Phyllobacterium sp. A18/5-2]|uniref:dienelactone hydrolase family protein n=1 Tax=Phyllobacterium sp. A18/5-2 TaxID=2978392 RepID=UPI0021C5FB68|nr:dienelactone hydrolase family protein [Phyllobacterium sp. A18/5-2]UXN66396.1 dienelactone hydrolase family protein [Phyllobacterium sp. A18/5-2]